MNQHLKLKFYLPFLFFFTGLSLLPRFLWAQSSPRPESARPYGMGNAYGALSNDASAIFFNPAGLGTVKQIEISGSGSRFFSEKESAQTDLYAAGTIPLQIYQPSWPNGTAGFMLHRLERPGGDTITSFGAGWGINPAEAIPKKWRVGQKVEGFHTGLAIRARQIKSALTSQDSFGLGLDLGFLYQFPQGTTIWTKNWSAGLAIQEVNSASISSPVLYRLGSAWKYSKYQFALDMVSQGGETRFLPGMEAAFFREVVLLRLGSGYLPEKPRQIVIGFGIVLPPIQMDLAYGFPTRKTSEPNDRILVSFTYRFGTPLLSQFLYKNNEEKLVETENKLTDLESKKITLQSLIREQKNLHETMLSDYRRTKSKRDELENRTKDAEEKLRKKEQEVEKLDKRLLEVQALKAALEKSVQSEQALRRKTEDQLPRKIQTHKAAKGETLRGLAEKYYGDPERWTLLYEVNEKKIIRGTPKEGEELIIP